MHKNWIARAYEADKKEERMIIIRGCIYALIGVPLLYVIVVLFLSL